MTLDEFFEGHAQSRQLFEAVRRMVDGIGASELKVTVSQIAFWRQKPFAWAWVPGKYLRGRTAPLVLTVGLRRRDGSTRWKQIVEPSPGRFTHHLELFAPEDLDPEVRVWLREAWLEAAGPMPADA